MFTTQFALSLELSNLIPLAIEGAQWGYDKILSRDLQVCATVCVEKLWVLAILITQWLLEFRIQSRHRG